MSWIKGRLESLFDNLVWAAFVAGGVVLWAAIKQLSIEWLIVIGLVLFVLILSCLRLLAHWLKESDKPSLRREQGIKIHQNIIGLVDGLDEIKRELPTTEDWLNNPKVRKTLDNLQIEFNNLGYLVQNKKYDRWVEAGMEFYSKKLVFHLKSYNEKDEWGRAKINTILRNYVNNIRG